MSTSSSPSYTTANRSVYSIRGIVFTALFAAVFIAFSWLRVPLGFTAVPITLQTLAIMLAGGLLGAFYGFWSIAIVVLLTATGLPLFHGNGGISLLLGKTGGFIWMYPFAALFIGFVSDRLFRNGSKFNLTKYITLFAALMVFGVALVYVTGVPWYAHTSDNMSLQQALVGACYPFLPGDTVKAVVALILIPILRPLLPKLRP
ncbi:biotin transport system substrate-specific component [Paenibacillus phyllosphaerae]|uniref:Biotin transporter n=1 Tax=Paenibacillus phyllosphaerae TaxID=274593 RepID=A0A7W5B3M1_9BACL|nr:biotin transporter BioY [Paenibacillus phyllosphaerae]MBB3113559.1 biotin transport system substrate-specific component [Paenibacillus phyllosphaerae]